MSAPLSNFVTETLHVGTIQIASKIVVQTRCWRQHQIGAATMTLEAADSRTRDDARVRWPLMVDQATVRRMLRSVAPALASCGRGATQRCAHPGETSDSCSVWLHSGSTTGLESSKAGGTLLLQVQCAVKAVRTTVPENTIIICPKAW